MGLLVKQNFSETYGVFLRYKNYSSRSAEWYTKSLDKLFRPYSSGTPRREENINNILFWQILSRSTNIRMDALTLEDGMLPDLNLERVAAS
jgi:hypothetical protein